MFPKRTLSIPGERLVPDSSRLPLALCLLTFAVSIGLGVLIAADRVTLLVLAFAALGGLVLVVRPMLAFYLLIPVSMLGQFQEIPGSPLDLAQLIGLAMIAGVLLQILTRKIVLRRSVLDLPILLLIGAHLAGMRGDTLRSADLTQLFSFLSILVTYYLCFQLLDSTAKVRTALLIFVASVTIVDLLGLGALVRGQSSLQLFGRELRLFGNWGSEARLGGFFEQPNVFGQLIILALPVCAAMTIAPETRRRLVWATVAIINTVALLLAQSRSAVIGGAIALLIVVFFSSKQQMVKRLVLGAILVSATLAITDYLGLLSILLERMSLPSLLNEQADAYLYLGRTLTFSKSIEIFLNNPLGVGYGEGSIILGGLLGVAERSTHNVLLSWAVELGVLGLLAGGWLLYAQIASLGHLTTGLADPQSSAISAGLLGAVLATWIHNLFHSTIVWLPVWILFAIASAAVTLYAAKEKIDAESKTQEHSVAEAAPSSLSPQSPAV